MDFNGLNRVFFYRTYQTYQTYRTPKLVGSLTCRPVGLRCGYSDMKESLKPRK